MSTDILPLVPRVKGQAKSLDETSVIVEKEAEVVIEEDPLIDPDSEAIFDGSEVTSD